MLHKHNCFSEHKLTKDFQGVKAGDDLPWGFPTLQTLPFVCELKFLNANIFGSNSRRDSMLLKLQLPELQTQNPEEALLAIANQLLGKSCFVNWPYFKEAKVVAFSTPKGKFTPNEVIAHKGDESDYWKKDANYAHDTMITKRALEVGDILVMLHVKVLDSKLLLSSLFAVSSNLHQEWKKNWMEGARKNIHSKKKCGLCRQQRDN